MEPTTFYYSDGKKQFGPFSREELKSQPITADTLVWFEGLPRWKRAGDLTEMSDFLSPMRVEDYQPVQQPAFQPVHLSDSQPVQQTGPQPVHLSEPQPVQQADFQPAHYSDFQPVQQSDAQPIQQSYQQTAQPKSRKNFTRLLFIFSSIGVFLGLLMMAFSIGVALRLSVSGGLFFFVCAHLFIFISVIVCLKMGRELNVDWKKFL